MRLRLENSTVLGEARFTGNGLGLTLLGVLVGVMVAGPTLTVAQKGFFGRAETSPYKGYSGIRIDPQARRVVYHHDQLIAVVELGPNRRLLGCELIEVYNNFEKKGALYNLTSIAKPYAISFADMMDLMERCHRLDTPKVPTQETTESESRGTSSSILSGVLPGTKWCGAGDLARNYYDLGEESNIDKCCRTHDLCPAKVRSYTTRYNLTNDSIYTKSHCRCDSQFHKCLKKQSHPTADIMGNIYFNLLRVPCIQDGGTSRFFQLPDQYQ